ncbi:MAG: hypothetical protein PVG51_12515, partial [Desulfosarcina sp.]
MVLFKRDGTRQIGDTIAIEDKDCNPITIEAGTDVEAFFDLDIYELSYSYTFFQDERIDLAVGLGFYIMPIDFGLRATGAFETGGSEILQHPC